MFVPILGIALAIVAIVCLKAYAHYLPRIPLLTYVKRRSTIKGFVTHYIPDTPGGLMVEMRLLHDQVVESVLLRPWQKLPKEGDTIDANMSDVCYVLEGRTDRWVDSWKLLKEDQWYPAALKRH